MKAGADEFVPLTLIAIEDININRSCDTTDTSVGGQLPVDELHVGLVFTIAGYPHIVTLFDVGGMRHVLVDKQLTDIKDWTHVGAAFDIVHEDADATHKLVVTTNLLDLGVGGLYVKDWREITRAEQGMIDEIGGLCQCRTL